MIILNTNDIAVLKVRQIGKKDQGVDDRSRYLLLEFSSSKDRNIVKKEGTKLKSRDDTKLFFMKADSTKKEREEHKRLYGVKKKVEEDDPGKSVCIEFGKLYVDDVVADQISTENNSFFMNKTCANSLNCVSWDIAGKCELLKMKEIQIYLEKYDIICLTETHTVRSGTINFPKFKCYGFPDFSCNFEHPRGGICLLVKNEIKDFIKHVNLLMTDFIQITFTNNSKLVNLYIPPIDSVYYDEQYIELLCSVFIEADRASMPIVLVGDLNARMGELNDINENYVYNPNPDTTINENGKHIKEILFNTTSALPLNNLNTSKRVFGGGFTFKRNYKQSQIDWCFSNTFSLPNLKDFTIIRDSPKISDHDPIHVKVEIKGEKSLDSLVQGAKDLNQVPAKHSNIPKINKSNINLKCLNNLLKLEVEMQDVNNMSSHEIAKFLTKNIQRFGKISKLPIKSHQHTNEPDVDSTNRDPGNHYNALFMKHELENGDLSKKVITVKSYGVL